MTGGVAGGAVAIGNYAGSDSQNDGSIAIGQGAGAYGQGLTGINFSGAIAIGFQAGTYNQGDNAIAIGSGAGGTVDFLATSNPGTTGQGEGAIAIGYLAGSTGQSQYSVAIGYQAGCTGQGEYAVAIGNKAGALNQHNNTIIISGSQSEVNSTQTNSFYVAPVRVLTQNIDQSDGGLQYHVASGEIYSNTNKSFIIDHPLDNNKLLVHACLEGPEVGVYYRGKGEIINGTSVVIQLPSYVGQLCNGSDDFTVQITHIYDGKVKVFSAGEVNVENNTFSVYGENGRFNWLVHGKRGNLKVECDKHNTTVKGDGPYKYIV